MPYSSISKYVVRVLIMLIFGVMGVVLAEASDPMQDDPPAQDAPMQDSPQDCATCHVDVVADWQDGMHAKAFSDPIFQEYWQEQGEPAECLACHTTGFVAFTGEYAHEGVTCSACHGDVPANHPPEPVSIDANAEVCADCHTTTYLEWQRSAHGEQQLGCTTCHDPHPQGLRFDDSRTLCLNCHDWSVEPARDDYIHLAHEEQACVDCHWHHAALEDLLMHYETGNLFPTGHDALVETRACVDCHADISESVAVEEGEQIADELGLTSAHPLHEAQVRIEELKSEVNTLEAQGANTSSLRLAQGFVVGIAIGGVLIVAVARFRRRSFDLDEREEE